MIFIYKYCQNSSRRRKQEGGGERLHFVTSTGGSRTQLPAVCSLRGQDVREEHLRQLPQVKELFSATAKSDVEVRAIFLQGSLLEKLHVLYYAKKARFLLVSLFKDRKTK